jgi:L-threonylcarbamoyladenylate synthase
VISQRDVEPEGAVLIGAPVDVAEYARMLYHWLREADVRRLDVLVAVSPPEEGIGAAVADRLRRAAADRGLEERAG